MKKIISREEKDKKLKRNQWIIGIVLIFLMIFSTLGFAFSFRVNDNSSINQEIEYNGIKFSRDGTGFWKFNVQDI